MKSSTIFIFATSAIFLIIAYFLPKKISKIDNYTAMLFALGFGLFIDTILAVKYKFYVLDEAGVQIPPLIGQVFLYTCTSIFILNTYPFHKKLIHKCLYICVFSLLTLGYEWLAHKFGFIKYNEWKIYHSAISYPFLILLLLGNFKFMKYLKELDKNKKPT